MVAWCDRGFCWPPNSALQPPGSRLQAGAARRAGSRQRLNGGVRRFLMVGLVLSASVSALCLQQPDSSGKWTLVTVPVTVTAKLVELVPPDLGFTAAFTFVIDVGDPHATREVQTFFFQEDLDSALAHLRAAVAWRPPYLFVRSECGGNAWACDKEDVFIVAEGRARWIGAFAIDSSQPIPQSYRGGYFMDCYDKLEEAQIGLSHASSPYFDIAIRLIKNRLVVAPDITWSMNQDRYLRNEAAVAVWLAERKTVGEHDEEAFSAVVENAVLAKYCKRHDELTGLLGRVEPRLGEDDRRNLRRALALTFPLELPSAWRGGD